MRHTDSDLASPPRHPGESDAGDVMSPSSSYSNVTTSNLVTTEVAHDGGRAARCVYLPGGLFILPKSHLAS